MIKEYKQCKHCILDTHDDPEMTFDSNGVCNYCRDYEDKYIRHRISDEERQLLLEKTILNIKEAGKGKKYDSIMGLSGGVDSSYLALKAKEFGLNPLIVHFDNGWNSELAVKNIENIINYTGFDLFTYVVDWEEFRDLQLAYIRAGVLDWEVPTDHGFLATLARKAYQLGIKYILTGHNHQTEAILPKTMRWGKMDVANIKDIHARYGTTKLKTFPLMGFFEHTWYQRVRNFERVNLLEFIEYDKKKAKELITNEFGWRDYGGKHYESIFTRFYQGYVLIKKFGFDKRKAHLSNLICSGQISREQALSELATPPYNPDMLEEDKEYVVKKLGISMKEFEDIMAAPPVPHLHFKSYETGLYVKHRKFMQRISPLTRLLKRFLG